jgi:hypothetical protein
MPLPIILALAGAFAGGALGAYGGVKLGSWLKSTLTPEQEKAVARACSMFGVASAHDVEKLPPAKQKEFAEKLEEIKGRG